MTSIALWPLLACFAVSFVTCGLIILTQGWHGKLSLDHDLDGVQKIHDTPVPRVGGLGVVAGLVIAAALSYRIGGEDSLVTTKLLLCAIPAFGAGLIEDFTKRVGVRTRLFASFISAAIAYYLVNAQLIKLDTLGLDYIIQFTIVSFLFTCFAVGGITNAINIIDGLNGLASGCVTIMLAGIALLAWQHNDVLVMQLCLLGITSIIGFFFLNYPFGHIFLGDGGAYLAGFWLAECGVLLLNRNPTISTWAVLLACIYPAWETVYSMYRRQVIKKVKSGEPDMTHLHHLVYKSQLDSAPVQKSWLTHGIASIKIWIATLFCQIGAFAYQRNTKALVLFTVLFTSLYVLIYRSKTKIHTSNNTEFSDTQEQIINI